MYGYLEIESVQLFHQVEELRVSSLTTIKEMAFLCGVTELAYKNWKNKKAIPRADKISYFRGILTKFSGEEAFQRQYAKNVRRIKENRLAVKNARIRQAELKRLEEE